MSTTTSSYTRTKMLATLAMMGAVAYILMYFLRIPISTVDFLKYDPKDIIIAIAGFLYGPMPAVLLTVVVSLLEMVTVSTTGIIGFIMNVLATCAFVCPPAYLYKKRHTISAAVGGLILGVLAMVAVMLMWNYFITPLYMGLPREAVAAMLLPVFLPFNLIKGGINAALVLILYKPLARALRKSGLAAQSSSPPATGTAAVTPRWGALLGALVVLVSCVFAVLVWRGII